MFSFRRCWDTYDAMDEALALEMKEALKALKHGDLDRHGKLILKRATFIKERHALSKEYEAEQEAKKAEAARKQAQASK